MGDETKPHMFSEDYDMNETNKRDVNVEKKYPKKRKINDVERLSDRIIEIEKRLLVCEMKFDNHEEFDLQKQQVNKKRRLNLGNVENECTKMSCMLEKIQLRDDNILRLQADIKKKDTEILNLKEKLEEQMKFACGAVFHSSSVFKGSDIPVPCACRQDYTLFLPDEVMLKIFGYIRQNDLNQLSRVCARWNKLCYDKSLWKKIDMRRKSITSVDIEGYQSIGVESLNLKYCKVTKEKFPKAVTFLVSASDKRKICSLTYLNLCGAIADSSVIEKLIGRCRNLEFLDVSFCAVTTKAFENIKKNANLKTLRLKSLQDTCSFDIIATINSCKKIEVLDLSGSVYAFATARINFPEKLTHLAVERVFTCQSDVPYLERIILSCPHIQELNISHCTGFDMDIIDAIVCGLLELKVLKIEGLEDILFPRLGLLSSLKDFQEIQGDFSLPSVEHLRNMLHVKISGGVF